LSADSRLNVVLADQNQDREWPPNYGVWQDEWEAIVERYTSMGVRLSADDDQTNCVDRAWNVTDCYFGGSFDIPTERRLRVDRPYYRIDRLALRRALLGTSDSSNANGGYTSLAANHVSATTSVNLYEPVGSLQHDQQGTTATLQTADGTNVSVRTRLVVDCTGHETKLVLRDARDVAPAPGFQIAYGILCDVDEASFSGDKDSIGPYDTHAMTLFDYRTDHYDDAEEEEQKRVAAAPTFMYGT
jgi:lycopene beta-cyclase